MLEILFEHDVVDENFAPVHARPTQSTRMSAWQAEIGCRAHFGRRAHFRQKWSSTATKGVAHRHQTSRDPPVGQTSAACDA